MTIIKTPFGDMNLESGELLRSLGSAVVGGEQNKDDWPSQQSPGVFDITDPSVAFREEARTDGEGLRFQQLRRLCVSVNEVCLAHKYWRSRTSLAQWEQQDLAGDRKALQSFNVSTLSVPLREAGDQVTLEDVKRIAARFPNREVWWRGELVTA